MEYKGFNIRIEQDDYSETPRDWDNVSKMVCNHRNYELGDEQISNPYANSWEEELAYYVAENHAVKLNLPKYDRDGILSKEEFQRVWKWIDRNMIVMPLYLYDHGGISISTSRSCSWDSGQVGYMYITKKRAVEEWGHKRFTEKVKERAYNCMEAELETYDDYLRGDVYMFNIERDGEHVDSCGGFYGYDHEKSGLMEHAREIVDYQIKQELKEHLGRLKRWILGKVPFQYRDASSLI